MRLLLLTITLWFSFLLSLWLWPNTIKLSKRVRTEFYYWDFIFGLLIFDIFIILLLGFYFRIIPSFNVIIETKFEHLIRALLAGIIVNLAFFLQISAAFLCGITFAFIASYSVGVIAEGFLRILSDPHSYPPSVLWIIVNFGIAVLFMNIASRRNTEKSQKSKKAILYCTISGILFTAFLRIFTLSFEIGNEILLPRFLLLFLISGMILCNLALSWFFCSRPLSTSLPFSFSTYFQQPLGNHLMGFIGGILACAAIISRLYLHVQITNIFEFICAHLYPLGTGLIGIFYWKEYKEHPSSYKYLIFAYICFILAVVFLGLNEWSIAYFN